MLSFLTMLAHTFLARVVVHFFSVFFSHNDMTHFCFSSIMAQHTNALYIEYTCDVLVPCRKAYFGGHNKRKRADSNDATPVWCRNCSGCVGAVWSRADEPLSTERKDTKKQKKMLKNHA